MRPLIPVLIAATALTAAAAPALAQTAGDRADARCLLVLQVIGRNPANKEAATQGIFYYLGRLQAHGLGAKQLEPLFLAEAKAMPNQQQGQAEATRCNTELTAHSAELRTVFQNLQKSAPPPATPPRPAPAPAPK